MIKFNVGITKYETTKKYRGIPKGTKCYESYRPSYGLIGEDERETGLRHMLMTEVCHILNKDENYTSFTFPVHFLKIIEEDDPKVIKYIKEKTELLNNQYNERVEQFKKSLYENSHKVYGIESLRTSSKIVKGKNIYTVLSQQTLNAIIDKILVNDEFVKDLMMCKNIKIASIEFSIGRAQVCSSIFGPKSLVDIKSIPLFIIHYIDDSDFGFKQVSIEIEPKDIVIHFADEVKDD